MLKGCWVTSVLIVLANNYKCMPYVMGKSELTIFAIYWYEGKCLFTYVYIVLSTQNGLGRATILIKSWADSTSQ